MRTMRASGRLRGFVLLAGAWFVSNGIGRAAPVPGADVTYTVDADFDQGTLLSVNHDAPNSDQLQLSKPAEPFPFVNIAASGRGTIERLDANTGAILGEYLTAPDGRGRNPSRTTVDQLGSVWVANRNEGDVSGGEPKGSIARIGLVIGGTRSDADGSVNPSGGYLKPPFDYSTCVDRDGDGLLRTSGGLGDVLPWPNTGGADTHGGVSTAEDECIINYVRVNGTGTRTVAVDANNDVWVGGVGDLDHEKIDAVTGLAVPETQFNLGCGGYGGLLDGNGVLWSARGGSGLLRYDTNTESGVCLDGTFGDYGLGIDPQTGHIWHTHVGPVGTGAIWNSVCEIAPDGTLMACYAHGNDSAQGVAVDGNGNVWVAHSLSSTTVGHLRTDGTFVGIVDLPGGCTDLPGGCGPTGVAVDANGKIWVANLGSSTAMRIDPDAGPIGGGFPVGEVDLTVDLGAGASPYNYSDMTGFVAIGSTSPQGTWTVTQDSGAIGRRWDTAVWNTEPEASEPLGTVILVEGRAADSESALASESYFELSSGVGFALTGRYLDVRVTLKASASGVSPVLSDIRLATSCGNGVPDPDELCDDGDADDCNACHNDCTPNANACGDGHLCPPEQCDDANLASGDCCSATCGFEASESPCEADGNLCTTDTCDGNGRCTFASLVTCQAADPPCESGETCEAAAGCVALPDASPGTGCQIDQDPCTVDQCDGSGECVPLPELALDLPCEADDDACTVDACDGAGICVFQRVDPERCVDHYLCYGVKPTTAFDSIGVSLADQFEMGTADVKRPVALCPPASKNLGPVIDTTTHEEAYKIKVAPKHVRQTGIEMSDQFGTLTVDTLVSDRLLVPTNKGLGWLPGPPTPGAADHYKCYRVKIPKVAPKFPKGVQVNVADQFQTRLYDVKKPSRLCNPVDKDGGGILKPAAHLMCYKVKLAKGELKHTPVVGLIHTSNQFGPGQVDTKKGQNLSELCVPALKSP